VLVAEVSFSYGEYGCRKSPLHQWNKRGFVNSQVLRNVRLINVIEGLQGGYCW